MKQQEIGYTDLFGRYQLLGFDPIEEDVMPAPNKTTIKSPVTGSLAVACAAHAVSEAVKHHYTALSAGPNPDCNHWHFKHHIRDCPPYLDKLDALVNATITDYETVLGICHNYAPTPGKSDCGDCESCHARGIRAARSARAHNHDYFPHAVCALRCWCFSDDEAGSQT